MKKTYEKPVLTKRGILSSVTAQVVDSGSATSD
ncbi:putative RiPP precursor [Mesorhizobium sp. M0243]